MMQTTALWLPPSYYATQVTAPAPISIASLDAIDLNLARQMVGAQTGPDEAPIWALFNDDHWQNGAGWTGPRLDGEGAESRTVMSEIERQFIYSNVAREIGMRHVNSVLYHPPHYGAVLRRILAEGEVSNATEQTLIGELDGLLAAWSDSPLRGTYTDKYGRLRTCDIHRLLHRAGRMLIATGRANLRLFIPPKRRDENGGLPDLPFGEALNRIFVELCEPGAAAVYPDRERMESIGVYVWLEGGKEFAEVSYLDASGNTVLRRIGGADAQGTEGDAAPVIKPLDGGLLHFEMSDDPLLLGSILSQQRGINKTLTMGDRNTTLAGFPERVLKDVQLAGKFVADANAPNGKRFVPDPIEFGAGTVNNLRGIEYTDAEGKKHHVPPGYERLEPISNNTFDDAVERARFRILDEAFQTVVRMEGDATASGISRETAKDGFKKSLGFTVIAVTSCGLWLYNAATGLAAATSTEPQRYATLRVDFGLIVDLGPVSSAERAEDREQVAAGMLSRETAMTRAGIEDVDAERGRVATEAEASTAQMQERADLVETLTRSGAGIEGAAVVAGFDEQQAAKLTKGDFEEPDDPDNSNNPGGGSGGTGAGQA